MSNEEDEIVDSDEEGELPDFPTQNASGSGSNDNGHTAHIQDIIDRLNSGLIDDNEVDADEPLISLSDLESATVILDANPTGATQDIFQKLGELGLGME